MSPRNTASQAAGDPPLELGDLDDPRRRAILRSPAAIHPQSAQYRGWPNGRRGHHPAMGAHDRRTAQHVRAGPDHVRSSVWKEMGKLGIQDNPIAKGRYLISQ
jgi:hypothetical protein